MPCPVSSQETDFSAKQMLAMICLQTLPMCIHTYSTYTSKQFYLPHSTTTSMYCILVNRGWAICGLRNKFTEVLRSCKQAALFYSISWENRWQDQRQENITSRCLWLWQTSKFWGTPQLQQTLHSSCDNSKLPWWFNSTYRHGLELTTAKDVVRRDFYPQGTVKVCLHLLLSLWWTCPTASTAYGSLCSVIQ